MPGLQRSKTKDSQGRQAVVLVGGLGTRLRAALPDVPKPMAPINGRPFLEYIVTQLRGFGIDRIVFCVGYKAGSIEGYFDDGKRFGVRIEYSREEELLGTAGALKLAQPKIEFDDGFNDKFDDFLLFNGDCFCEFDGRAFVKFHQSKKALVTILATHIEDRARFGSLLMSDTGAVLDFEEKGRASGAGWINAGIYVLNKRVLDMIPVGEKYSLEQEVFPRLCGNGLFAFPTRGEFIDIGLPEEWWRAQTLLPDKIKL